MFAMNGKVSFNHHNEARKFKSFAAQSQKNLWRRTMMSSPLNGCKDQLEWPFLDRTRLKLGQRSVSSDRVRKKNPADCISVKKGDSTFTIHLISGSSGGGVKLTARHFIQSHSHTLISYIRILIVPSPRSNKCKCSRGRASVCELKSEWDSVCVHVRVRVRVCVCVCVCVWV